MAFGNPYNEDWSVDLLLKYVHEIHQKGIQMISLADTIGQASDKIIAEVYSKVCSNFNSLDVGLHLHTHPDSAIAKINSAWNAGCQRFDVAIGGYGGCPFTNSQLIGNLSTEKMLNFIADKNIPHSLNTLAFENAYNFSKKIFN